MITIQGPWLDFSKLPKHIEEQVRSHLSVGNIVILIEKSCKVEILPNGGAWIPIPRDAPRADWSNPIPKLFTESNILAGAMLRHGRFYTMYELLCDGPPEDEWYEDELLYNLLLTPVWSIGTVENHVETTSRDLIIGFSKCFAGDLLKSYDETTEQEFHSKFYEKVMKNVSSTIYYDVDAESAYQVVVSNTERGNVHRDIFLCAIYAFLEEYMIILSKDFNKLKADEILVYYSTLWKNLVPTLEIIVNELKERFTEEKAEQFGSLLKKGTHYWKKIWFQNEMLPRAIKQIYDNTKNGIDISKLITPEIIQSYTSYNMAPTPYDYYNFMQWHITKYAKPKILSDIQIYNNNFENNFSSSTKSSRNNSKFSNSKNYKRKTKN
uniref:Uncharacterized protein n=1 Tax=Acrobeloides nanus TaxID=290746 RepID=A0A914C9M1_9BILA